MSRTGQAEVVSLIVYVQDAMYSSYTSILLVVVTHCCLHSRYQQAEIGRAGTSRHPALDNEAPREALYEFRHRSGLNYQACHTTGILTLPNPLHAHFRHL